jgi:hypothetical protein
VFYTKGINMKNPVVQILKIAAPALTMAALCGADAFAATAGGGTAVAGVSGITDALTSVRTSVFTPIIGVVAGLGVAGGTVGTLFRPDKRELLTAVAGTSLAALVGVGGAAGIATLVSTSSGAVIR